MIDFLKGKKFYILMGVGALTAITQYFFQIDLQIPELPLAKSIGGLIQEIYAFAVGASARAAVAKIGD